MRNAFYTALLGLLVAANNGYSLELTDKVDIFGEVRAKNQLQMNYDFDSDVEGDDHYSTLRTSLGFTVKPVDMLDVTVQVRDWRVLGAQGVRGYGDDGQLHVYQANFTAKFADDKFRVKAGRQEVVVGTGRLFSNNDGYNGLYHDGVTLSYLTEKHKFHLIGVKLGEASLPGGINRGVDYADNTAYILWYNWTPAEKRDLHVHYSNVKLNSTALDTTLHSLDVSWDDDSYEKLFYGVELVLQFGSHEAVEQDISASAFHGHIGGKFGEGKHRVWLAIDGASGNDEDGEDDMEFNNLFGKNELSLIDFVAWRNVAHAGIQYQGKFIEDKLTLDLGLHLFSVMSEYGNLYAIDVYNGATTVMGGVQNEETALATEFDIALGYAWNEYLDFSTGLAFFAPGDAYGSDLDAATLFYLGGRAKF